MKFTNFKTNEEDRGDHKIVTVTAECTVTKRQACARFNLVKGAQQNFDVMMKAKERFARLSQPKAGV